MRNIVILFLLFFTLSTSAAESYKRIVSLAPSLTHSLYYLEAQSLLVGCTSYCRAAKADRKPVVANAVTPNIEKIVSLKPDLVITTGLTSLKDVETIRKFGIKVEVFESPKSFEQICSLFQELGQLVGHAPKAKAIVLSSKERVAKLQQHIKKRNQKVFIQLGSDPLFGVIPNTFMNDYITLSGGKNILSELKHGTVTREAVVARQPDYIFIVTMGTEGEPEKREWERFRNLPAVKNKKIFTVNSDLACQAIPVTFVETLEIFIKKIQQ